MSHEFHIHPPYPVHHEQIMLLAQIRPGNIGASNRASCAVTFPRSDKGYNFLASTLHLIESGDT